MLWISRIRTFVFVFILFFLFSSKTYASNFSTVYNSTYDIGEDGNTRVTFNISLINESSNYYTSSYKLTTGFTSLENISARDTSGKITPKLSKNQSVYSLELEFNKNVIGLLEKQNFTISFDTKDVAKKRGKIWEVTIPGFEDRSEIKDAKVNVKVPKSFDKAAYVKTDSQNFLSNDPSLYTFSREDLGKPGITMAFGEKQTYSFNLTYHLKNEKVFPVKTEIALPPTTNYQDVYIENISPKPLNVKIDKDGNWLAEYNLMPSEKKDIIVKGYADLFLSPKKEILSQKELSIYLKENKFWESNNPEIKKLAKDLKTPFAIHKYVVKNLKYDFSRVSESKPRLGALKVLNTPYSAVCLEFTDLFIALARAAGIPAREVDGFAYTENSKLRPLSLVSDILHAWPEYYDVNSQTWIMVDPTWGNTTNGVDYFYNFDFNHVAFAIKGIESDYPIPAGGYKLKGQEALKDIDVKFSDFSSNNTQEFDIVTDLSTQIISGLPIKGKITVKNTGKELLEKQNARIFSDELTPKSQIINFEAIPPMGFITKDFTFNKTSFLTNKKSAITIQVANRSFNKYIKINPIIFNVYVLLGGAWIGLLLGAIYLIKKQKNYPDKPGIYIFFDKFRKALYVGKAKNLKNRISSYFLNKSLLDHRTNLMVSQIDSVRTIIVESEIESFLLEARFIKKLNPIYNVKLKDAKTYPVIRITIKDLFPKVLVTRNIDDKKSLYFGPYPNVNELKTVMRIIRRIFPFQSVLNHPKKNCLYFHLGLCPCPEINKTREKTKSYKKTIKYIVQFLKGDTKKVLKELEKERDSYSHHEKFEKANKVQDKINAVINITSPVHSPFEYETNPNLRSDLRKKEVKELKEVLSNFGVNTQELSRIECFDISNISGTNPTGSMIVFIDGEKDTSGYRRFQIKQKGPNDFAMMGEVLLRRFKHKEWDFPDLIIVDGGKGQVSEAQKVKRQLGFTNPIIGLAKRNETIVTEDFRELNLKKDSLALLLLRRIRDEAHRFAITYHKKLRSKFIQ